MDGHPFDWEVGTPTALTIGVFDGVHRGHRQVITDLVKQARIDELSPAIVTFDPHPMTFLDPQKAPEMLTGISQRLDQFRSLGIEIVGVLHFPDVRELSPDEFAERVLMAGLSARRVVIGADFRFGKNRTGEASSLIGAGNRLGFSVSVVEMLADENGVISATRVRQLLLAGQVEEASVLLDRPYQLEGIVVKGDGRGKTIGFPTANLRIPAERLIPANGVYAARAVVQGEFLKAVVNIGTRPTFNGEARTVETHLLDFAGDLYDHQVVTELLKRLRGEQRFDTVGSLVTQIEADIVKARAILAPNLLD
ncbi:MAG: bifunctional riboflavin kinase/FAD synthetase [Actinomycetota bacterium]